MRSCVLGRTQLFFVGFAARKRFLLYSPPPPLFLFLLSSQLSRRTRAETFATQATHHKASSREHGKSQEFRLGSEKACGHLCRDSWKLPEILEKKNSKLSLKAEFSRIGLVTVFDAILTSRQTREKL